MYLYVFENCDVWQMPTPPTAEDQRCVQDGSLVVFCIESGKYQELDRDLKWKDVATGEHRFIDKDKNSMYSCLAESHSR